MTRARTKTLLLLALVATTALAAGVTELPDWAYPMSPPDFKAPVDDGVPRRVAGSDVTYSLTQLTNLRSFVGPDWHPQDHAPMPPVVANGRAPNVFACAYCHRADGSGGPENASLHGLPAAYIVQQMADFKSGARTTSVANRNNIGLMIALSKSISDEDVAAAAAYFSQIAPKARIRVIETAQAPRARLVSWFYGKAEGGGTEVLGDRILEVPDDLHQFESRDARSTFTAYVPVGSIARGELLVRTGGGTTLQCAICHGADLKGLGNVPPLAGRSPSYLARQLYDFKTGARTGPSSELMKQPVAALTGNDIIAITAYLGSLKP
jgi:cytochrome c553